jgi:hypothetical protein
VLIAVHSFTPVFEAAARPWHISVLYNRDTRLAKVLMELLRCEQGLVVGDNEPYSVTDASDYTIPIHGEQRDLHHVLIEIRWLKPGSIDTPLEIIEEFVPRALDETDPNLIVQRDPGNERSQVVSGLRYGTATYTSRTGPCCRSARPSAACRPGRRSSVRPQ